MRPATTLMHLAMAISSVTPVLSAWPGWLPRRESLIARAESDGSSVSATATQDSGTEVASSPSETGSAADDGKTTDSLDTSKPTSSGTRTASGGKKSSSSPKPTKFPQDAPLGGVEMIQPASTDPVTALYPIARENVTFKWNYTSLLGTPTAVDVLAACSKVAATWTLTANMSFATSGSIVWDTGARTDSDPQPLLTAEYNLIVKDSDFSVGDTAKPGYLGISQGPKFGLYAPKPYKPYSEWTCPGCYASAAAHATDTRAVNFALLMSVTSVIACAWLSTGFGVN